MNALRGKIRTTMTNDSTLAAMLGAASRVYPGWPEFEISITEALPAYITYEIFMQGRSAASLHNDGQKARLTFHVWARTELIAWNIYDRLVTLFHKQRLAATGRPAMTVIMGTASVVPDEARGCRHLVADCMLGNMVEVT